ncbi:hypothetical protein GCM10010973_05510 [Cribrihabitans marinus]|nr:hypothetical protein GCM10010973_05510 [Cribrihabitans marinus]
MRDRAEFMIVRQEGNGQDDEIEADEEEKGRGKHLPDLVTKKRDNAVYHYVGSPRGRRIQRRQAERKGVASRYSSPTVTV